MRKLYAIGAMLAMTTSAYAAPFVTQVTQKGSLLIFPDIRIDGTYNTIVRLSNDGSRAIDVKCIWMDGNKNRTDFVISLSKNQTIWFDAKEGDGTLRINPMPRGPASGFDNPFLPGGAGPYYKGMLACFAVSKTEEDQVKWNHLHGTATVFEPSRSTAYEYNAYAFYAPAGNDQEPVGTAGTLELNGFQYDACPLYMTGALTPTEYALASKHDPTLKWFGVNRNRIAVASCALNLNQDWTPVYTKLQFDVWDSNETKLTGAYDCADSWHEVVLPDVQAASQVFTKSTVGTDAARYRVQGVKSDRCKPYDAQAVGVLVVESTMIGFGPPNPDPNTFPAFLGPWAETGTTLTAAGKASAPENKVVWDPQGAVPEGRIR